LLPRKLFAGKVYNKQLACVHMRLLNKANIGFGPFGAVNGS